MSTPLGGSAVYKNEFGHIRLSLDLAAWEAGVLLGAACRHFYDHIEECRDPKVGACREKLLALGKELTEMVDSARLERGAQQ